MPWGPSTVDLGSGSYHTSVMHSVRSNKSRHQTMAAVAAAGVPSTAGVPGVCVLSMVELGMGRYAPLVLMWLS